jgi:hypothetical protein
MSDLRDELEQGFSSVETQSETQTISDNVEEQPVSQEPAVIDEWMDAPKSYTKEYQDTFKTLSPDWRKYLIEREKQVERGFSEKNNRIESYKWADNAFNSRQERMAKLGFNKAQDYIEHMTAIDDALELNPAETIKALANAYGVNFGETTNSDTEVQRQIANIQQEMRSYKDFVKAQQQQQANSEFNAFINAKDEAGNPKHPYFEEVRADMQEILRQEKAANFEDAYEQAIYANKVVRQKIIDEAVKSALNSKVEAAKVAKDAGFSPKSKAQEEVRELSLREELENKFKEI